MLQNANLLKWMVLIRVLTGFNDGKSQQRLSEVLEQERDLRLGLRLEPASETKTEYSESDQSQPQMD
jgi:hypothetical protein